MRDIPFIFECCKDWPIHKDKGLVTIDKVDKWVQRWTKRGDEQAMVWDHGFMSYRLGPYYNQGKLEISPYGAVVDMIAVHPDHRNQGHSKVMRSDLKNYMFQQGVLVATFDTLAGPMQDKYGEHGVETAFREGI